MPIQERRRVPDRTSLPKPAETMSSNAATTTPERSTASESVKTSTTLSPTESEIATLAYQLWQDSGCPVGSHQEDWFLAKAMLRNALVAKCKDLSGNPLVPGGVARTEPEMPAEFQWKGCWVVWESEWSGAHWAYEIGRFNSEVSIRAA